MADYELQRFAAVIERHGVRAKSWLVRYGHMFKGLNLEGKSVLDVGAGCGWASFYAVAIGARRVVMVEPEAEGSRNAMLETARSIIAELGIQDVVEIIPTTLQDADLEKDSFDVAIIDNAINHLNEDATVAMHTDARAHEAFWPILRKIYRATRMRAVLIVTDASSRNFFGDRGWTAPFAPTIEWRKHQPPEVWAKLLNSMGWHFPRVDWTPLPRLGILGRILAKNKWGAYFLNSHFRLMVRKPKDGTLEEQWADPVIIDSPAISTSC